MINKKHIGSTFESFLDEDGILEEVNAAAVKQVLTRHLKEYMAKNGITKTKMAELLKTSRSALLRLLDPENYSVTLLTLNRAASVIGKKVNINLVPIVAEHKKRYV
jgi:predicted XRE-type DNA-binding protein